MNLWGRTFRSGDFLDSLNCYLCCKIWLKGQITPTHVVRLTKSAQPTIKIWSKTKFSNLKWVAWSSNWTQEGNTSSPDQLNSKNDESRVKPRHESIQRTLKPRSEQKNREILRREGFTGRFWAVYKWREWCGHPGLCSGQKRLHCPIQWAWYKQPSYGPFTFHSGLFDNNFSLLLCTVLDPPACHAYIWVGCF